MIFIRLQTCICKVITSLWQYFIMANYSWILMEGLYLHNLIFLALCTDTSTISLYVLLGWGKTRILFLRAHIVQRFYYCTLCSIPRCIIVYRSTYLSGSTVDYRTCNYGGYSMLDYSLESITVPDHTNTNYNIYAGTYVFIIF